VRGTEVAVQSEPETGLYRIEVLKEGMLSLVVEARGYKKRVVPAVATQGKSVERDIELAPAKVQSQANLRVNDLVSGEPVPALLRFEGADIVETRIDSSGSHEVLELPSGDYTVLCTAPGYLRMSRRITLRPEGKEELQFALLALGDPLTVRGITFAQSAANLKVESDIGVREVVELLKSNPEVRFEIGGHTDDTGSPEEDESLSLKRAQVFKRFLVKGYDIRDESLVTKGYGASVPVAENTSEEGRQKNRRVEIRAPIAGE
jgi:hypothetical protein